MNIMAFQTTGNSTFVQQWAEYNNGENTQVLPLSLCVTNQIPVTKGQ